MLLCTSVLLLLLAWEGAVTGCDFRSPSFKARRPAPSFFSPNSLLGLCGAWGSYLQCRGILLVMHGGWPSFHVPAPFYSLRQRHNRIGLDRLRAGVEGIMQGPDERLFGGSVFLRLLLPRRTQDPWPTLPSTRARRTSELTALAGGRAHHCREGMGSDVCFGSAGGAAVSFVERKLPAGT